MINLIKNLFSRYDNAVVITVVLILGTGMFYLFYLGYQGFLEGFDGDKKITEMNLNDAVWLMIIYCIFRNLLSRKKETITTVNPKPIAEKKDEDKK